MITLIVARARGGAIGRDNTIPWRAPEDLAFFQRETLGGAVIMGRRTWESLPFRPLKGRLNLVVSRNPVEGAETFATIAAAVDHAQALGHRRLYGMGGARVYAELLPLADRLLITEVALDVPGADTFFPDVPQAEWRRIGTHLLRAEGPRCELGEWLRRA